MTETIEVIKYKAKDGKIFDTENECLEYEEETKTIEDRFLDLCIDHTIFAECDIYENFGYGGNEYYYAVIEIKNENDIQTVKDYFKYTNAMNYENIDWRKYIGKKILVDVEFTWDRVIPHPKTKEELIEDFKHDINKYFKDEED